MSARVLRRPVLLATALGLALTLALAYWWLILESGTPDGRWPLDLGELRRLAASVPGERAGALRVEKVSAFPFPGHAVKAGWGWEPRSMTGFAYQLVFPDFTLVVDSTMAEAAAKQADPKAWFDGAAFARVQAALERARTIVVTHEHFDHLGGVTSHPHLAEVLRRLRLTREQVEHQEKNDLAPFPRGALTGYAPLEYERATAIAPGVVLVKLPGHTPGSQAVFVQLADGRETLLLGDVAWYQENVDEVRERARLVTAFFLGEDRDAVLRQLAALHALAAQEPGLALVPGHDVRVIERLLAQGRLTAGFVVDAAPPTAAGATSAPAP